MVAYENIYFYVIVRMKSNSKHFFNNLISVHEAKAFAASVTPKTSRVCQLNEYFPGTSIQSCKVTCVWIDDKEWGDCTVDCFEIKINCHFIDGVLVSCVIQFCHKKLLTINPNDSTMFVNFAHPNLSASRVAYRFSMFNSMIIVRNG